MNEVRDLVLVNEDLWVAQSLRDRIKPGAWLEVEWRAPRFDEIAYAVVRVNEYEAVGLVFRPDEAGATLGPDAVIAAVVGVR